VLYAGFGFTGLMEKVGVERRVYTAGESKMILDPFQPPREDDIKRLKSMQADVHDQFKALVRERRAGRLKGDEEELFSGAFWSGRQAMERGLVDGLGSLHEVVSQLFGPDAVLKPVARPGAWVRRLGVPRVFGFGGRERLAHGLADEFVSIMETRALWQRFGL
jgi:ClpP class serine protease